MQKKRAQSKSIWTPDWVVQFHFNVEEYFILKPFGYSLVETEPLVVQVYEYIEAEDKYLGKLPGIGKKVSSKLDYT